MLHIDPARLRPWIGPPPRATAPEIPDYVAWKHERFNITTGTVAGLALLPLWTFLLVGAVGLLDGRTGYSVEFTPWTFLLGALVSLILVPLLHEIVHGLAALAFRARPSFGIGPGFAYTTFNEPLKRAPYLVVGLAPLVVLSALVVLVAAGWDALAGYAILFGVVNASGAIGDLWMSYRIVRQPPRALYVDLADGFAVLVPVGSPALEAMDRGRDVSTRTPAADAPDGG